MLSRHDIYNNADEDEEDFAMGDDSGIQWSNIIFLPFHKTFKLFVLVSVIIKTVMGPIQSVYPVVYCWDVMELNSHLNTIKYIYLYFCDPIYGIDTFLHMVHRQVTDEAMKREYLPKSAFLIFLDVLSMVPLVRLVTSETCPPVQLWPNILNFSEFIIIYRIAEYFSMNTTHSYWKLGIGYTLIVFISINCVTCFLLLLTVNGLCYNCLNENYYDWRKFVKHKPKVSELVLGLVGGAAVGISLKAFPVRATSVKFNDTDENYTFYIYAAALVEAYVTSKQLDEVKPSTYLEFVVMSTFLIAGYTLATFVMVPRMFAEAVLRMRRIFIYHPIVQRITQETERRNPTSKAHLDVKKFYSLMWKKRGGITNIPEIIGELPKYLRIDIRLDLVWSVFFHSPTFRKTSSSFKRWICEHIRLDYKLPGERFFAGPHCHTHLFYLKSGIVQLISADDGITPLISVTSGTIFGDISFYLPPAKRKVTVLCLTYCEVFFLTRFDILMALHIYPDDRRMVIHNAKERIKHGRTLFTCKQHIRGLDRSEDEGIAWVKRRWWQISDAVSKWKQRPVKYIHIKCELPPEEAVYHCAKYIGQLVLCTESQLQMNSMFTNVKFPWIFAPESSFGTIWRRLVKGTVFLVMLLYPPYITSVRIPKWFTFFQFWADIIYVADIFVSLLTSTMIKENTIDNFAAVMFARCKTPKFVLDLLSTIWIERLVVLGGLPKLYYPVQFNRLLKIYVLLPKWDISKQPFVDICYKICLIQFCFIYFAAHIIYLLDWITEDVTTSYFFGEAFCKATDPLEVCHGEKSTFLNVCLAFALEYIFYEYIPSSLFDMYIGMLFTYVSFLFFIFCQTNVIAGVYLKHREIANYEYFVSNIKRHYQHYKIHPGLLRRLNKYLMCHWKYYRGMDVMHPELLKNEPYDIWFKVHGEVAEKILKQSSVLNLANPALIKELAYKAKFLILPKNSTIYLFGVQCKTVIWTINGHVKCEYHDENGEVVKTFYGPGDMLSTPSVFLGKPSLRNIVAYTECEILYIRIEDFFTILKHYPNEWAYFNNCIQKFSVPYNTLYAEYYKKHADYQFKLRQQIFNTDGESKLPLDVSNWFEPESKFILFWMLIRAITVAISITSASIQGGSGPVYQKVFKTLSILCDCVTVMDIALKMFFGYYDNRGLLISDRAKCVQHYLSHGFLLDVIGVLPIYDMIKLVMTKDIDENTALFMKTISKFAHLHLLTGYFDYISDTPIANMHYVKVLKWQVVTILTMFGASHYFVNYCIEFNIDSSGVLYNMTRRDNCWLPNYLTLDAEPTVHQLHMVFAESLNLAESGLMGVNLGKFKIDRHNLGMGIVLFILVLMFWYVLYYSLTLLVINFRGNTIFQHGVTQLRQFLTAERVEKKFIDRVIRHFRYWWLRTKGINMQNLMNERIGIVFRQDLSYYFFKKTFAALNTIIRGDEIVEKQFCNEANELYFLPGEEIVREMDLASCIYVVHRGRVFVKKNDVKIAVLTKGSVFGQLVGNKLRPVHISAQADDHADILQIPFHTFQDIISLGDIRKRIQENPQSKDDYLAMPKPIKEDPYDTVKYIIRGAKAIKPPWTNVPMNARNGNWYSRWLIIAWFLNPTILTIITFILMGIPTEFIQSVHWCLILSDMIHFANFISEFFTMELTVENGKCFERTQRWRYFRKLWCYVDIFSLILPVFVHYDNNYNWGFARLLRLYLFGEFHRHFCSGFKSRAAPIMLKVAIVFLMIHAMTCGWMYVACKEETFPIAIPVPPPHINKTIDYSEWLHPNDRKGGCPRITRHYVENGEMRFSFIVAKDWKADYIVAMSYILIIFTQSELDTVVAITLKQIYYKVVINFVMYHLYVWILSVAINAIYTKLRTLYHYDCSVNDLISYLDHNGLSPELLKSVREYTKQLWQRQKGNWLPELAHQAPQCLREDIFSALYIHHLQTPPLFQDVPMYFLRQMVSRLQRVVVFPGKFIVQEGDIVPAMYFIHEGEIEKWYTEKSGEKKMISVLTVNGYFGLIPGLYPNIPFHFSYYTRTGKGCLVIDAVLLSTASMTASMSTPEVKAVVVHEPKKLSELVLDPVGVSADGISLKAFPGRTTSDKVVDLVVLRYKNWQDLLQGYPQVKQDIYTSAKQLKRLMGHYDFK